MNRRKAEWKKQSSRRYIRRRVMKSVIRYQGEMEGSAQGSDVRPMEEWQAGKVGRRQG